MSGTTGAPYSGASTAIIGDAELIGQRGDALVRGRRTCAQLGHATQHRDPSPGIEMRRSARSAAAIDAGLAL